MQQLKMLDQRFGQARQMIEDIGESIRKDLVEHKGKDLSPEEHKFQLQALLARSIPINELLAMSAEMLYEIAVGKPTEDDKEEGNPE